MEERSRKYIQISEEDIDETTKNAKIIKESHMEKRTLYKEGIYKKGNLHTHTTWSDGCTYPQETAEHYRSKGYDFLALTDHWVYGIHPELNRDDFLVFPGTELGY